MSLQTKHGPLAQHRFRGRFETKLDPKGRLSLPTSYRAANALSNHTFIVTNSRFRNRSCLHVYTANEWDKLESKISRLSALQADIQAFSRFYISGGQTVELDSQGRFSIPQSLRRYAGLESQVMLVGLGDKYEIWSLGEWDLVYSELTDTFEETLNAVATAADALVETRAKPEAIGKNHGTNIVEKDNEEKRR